MSTFAVSIGQRLFPWGKCVGYEYQGERTEYVFENGYGAISRVPEDAVRARVAELKEDR